MDTSYTSYLVPVALAIYGYIFLFRTPEYMGRNGIATAQARRSEETWKYAHRVCGIYCFIAAAVIAALAYWQTSQADGVSLSGVFWLRMGIELAIIVLALPVMNALTKRKFPAGSKSEKNREK